MENLNINIAVRRFFLKMQHRPLEYRFLAEQGAIIIRVFEDFEEY